MDFCFIGIVPQATKRAKEFANIDPPVYSWRLDLDIDSPWEISLENHLKMNGKVTLEGFEAITF